MTNGVRINIKRAELVAVCERDGWVCYLCGEPIDPEARNSHGPSVDHVVPVSRGGEHNEGNWRAAHLICNIDKSDRTLDEYKAHVVAMDRLTAGIGEAARERARIYRGPYVGVHPERRAEVTSRWRQAVKWAHGEGYSVADIAREAGTTSGVVRNALRHVEPTEAGGKS